jgi:hypothetical protein
MSELRRLLLALRRARAKTILDITEYGSVCLCVCFFAPLLSL